MKRTLCCLFTGRRRGPRGIHGPAWHPVCSPVFSSFPFLVLSLIASQMLSKRESQRKSFSLRAECCQKTIAGLGFPFPWGLFLYGECEMAIFPVSIMRKQKYCFSLPRRLCREASSQVPAEQLLMELRPDPPGEESDLYAIS